MNSASTTRRVTVTVARKGDRHMTCQGTGFVIPTVLDLAPGMPAGSLRSGDPIPCEVCAGTGYC